MRGTLSINGKEYPAEMRIPPLRDVDFERKAEDDNQNSSVHSLAVQRGDVERARAFVDRLPLIGEEVREFPRKALSRTYVIKPEDDGKTIRPWGKEFLGHDELDFTSEDDFKDLTEDELEMYRAHGSPPPAPPPAWVEEAFAEKDAPPVVKSSRELALAALGPVAAYLASQSAVIEAVENAIRDAVDAAVERTRDHMDLHAMAAEDAAYEKAAKLVDDNNRDGAYTFAATIRALKHTAQPE